jgi:hypothetical protein
MLALMNTDGVMFGVGAVALAVAAAAGGLKPSTSVGAVAPAALAAATTATM